MLKKIVSVTVLTLLPIIIVISACNIQLVEAEPSNVIATYGPAHIEDVNGVLVLHVKGSPYEMGYQRGFLLKDCIEAPAQIQEIIDMRYSYEDLVNISQAMEPYIPQEYIQEMQGFADGANISYTDVLIGQIGIDILNYGLESTGCSGFAVFGNATMDGHLYHGRSLDVIVPPGEPTCLVSVYEPKNGTPFVSLGFPGMIGVQTGMNKEGITVEVNISPSGDKTFNGMPLFLMLRKVLQYSNNLTEATNIICQTDRTIGYNILLGDGKNLNAAVVEISDNYCKVFWAGDPAEDTQPHTGIPNAIRRTNHYVDPELAATQRSPYDPRVGWEWSWDRYEKLSQLILDNYGDIDAEMSIEFLRTPPVAWAAINLESVVFDSTDLELWVADAAFSTPAYLREFIYLSCNDLFPKGPGGPAIPAPASSSAPAAPRVSPRLKPAQMSVQYMSVKPKQTSVNQPVTITTNVVNTGDEAGNCNVVLKINGQVEQSKMVSVGPHGTQLVKFTVTKNQQETYAVDIGGQKGSFVITGQGGGAEGKSAGSGLILIPILGVLVIASVVVVLVAFHRPA